MTHPFDKSYWENHWASTTAQGHPGLPANPYVRTETTHLPVGSALDAGCGTGSEALWLAAQGWQVTGADISARALTIAAARAAAADSPGRIEWLEKDLARWHPDRTWDLVITSYAHPDIDQLAFYQRIASWVAPGGTLLIIGHLHGSDHGHDHPDGAVATQAGIAELFSPPEWHIDASYERTRTVRADRRPTVLRDVIIRARRAL